FKVVERGRGTYMGVEDIWILEELLHVLQTKQNFDQPGVVIVKGTEHGVAFERAEFRPFLPGKGRAAAVDKIQAREWADAIDALGIAERQVVPPFHERER